MGRILAYSQVRGNTSTQRRKQQPQPLYLTNRMFLVEGEPVCEEQWETVGGVICVPFL
jgi:hypothetical protein